MQHDQRRVDPASLRDEREEQVPERERVARVEPAVAELVDGPQREPAEVEELPHAREVEERVAAGEGGATRQSAIPSTTPPRRATGRPRPAVRPRRGSDPAERADERDRRAATTASSTSASVERRVHGEHDRHRARRAPPRLHARTAENARRRSARATSAPGRSRHAVAAASRSPEPEPRVRQRRARSRAPAARASSHGSAAHHSARAASRYMRAALAAEDAAPRSRSATSSSRRARSASRGPRCLANQRRMPADVLA